MDFAERGIALRYCDGKCASVEPDGFGELAVEGEKSAGSRGRAIQAADLNALFCAAQGCGQISCGVRRIQNKEGVSGQCCPGVKAPAPGTLSPNGRAAGQRTASYFDGGFAAAAARDKMYA